MTTVTSLYRGGNVQISEYLCHGGSAAPSESELPTCHELVFVRRGAFAVRIGAREQLATPNEVVLLDPSTEYRVRHPIGGGEDCTVFGLSAEAMDEIAAGLPASRSGPGIATAGAAVFRAQAELLDDVRRRRTTVLETEERLLAIAGAAVRRGGQPSQERSPSAAMRRRVVAAQELIAERFVEPLPLATVAGRSGASPFHLSRMFRRVAGTSMHRYQTRLRLRAALGRLSEGERDLTALALDLGFASHSHFTTAFGREFGIAPAAFRSAAAQRYRIQA